MNGMDGNSHYNGSLQFSGWARNGRKPTDADLTPEAAAFREYALTQATLALAYEQRTANMLLALQADVYSGRAWPHEIKSQIAARLGLNEGATK